MEPWWSERSHDLSRRRDSSWRYSYPITANGVTVSLTPINDLSRVLVAEHALVATAKRCPVTGDALSVLFAGVTDRLRSAPVALRDQGDRAVASDFDGTLDRSLS